MDIRESSQLWHDTYHKEALRENDLGLVRALYEQRISDLEQYIVVLENKIIEQESLLEEEIFVNFDCSCLKSAVEELIKLL